MEKGYIIFNHDLTKEQLLTAELDGQIYYPINKFTLQMRLCHQKHYSIIEKMMNDLFENQNCNDIEQDLTNNGTILIFNDDYSHQFDGTKVVEVFLPTDIDLVSNEQVGELEKFYQVWQQYDRINLINPLPQELSHLEISDYFNYHKEQNMAIIKDYIELAKIKLNEKKKRGTL